MSGTASGIPRATRREWIGLAIIALPCLLYSMDLTVLNLAVPHLSAALRPSSAQLLWIVDIYGFMIAGSLIPMGTLGGALAVAERLPEQLSTAVLGPAREAFTQGMQLNAAIYAVIALGTAVVVARQRSSTW